MWHICHPTTLLSSLSSPAHYTSSTTAPPLLLHLLCHYSIKSYSCFLRWHSIVAHSYPLYLHRSSSPLSEKRRQMPTMTRVGKRHLHWCRFPSFKSCNFVFLNDWQRPQRLVADTYLNTWFLWQRQLDLCPKTYVLGGVFLLNFEELEDWSWGWGFYFLLGLRLKNCWSTKNLKVVFFLIGIRIKRLLDMLVFNTASLFSCLYTSLTLVARTRHRNWYW